MYAKNLIFRYLFVEPPANDIIINLQKKKKLPPNFNAEMTQSK